VLSVRLEPSTIIIAFSRRDEEDASKELDNQPEEASPAGRERRAASRVEINTKQQGGV
jgi:hypothetical protein